MANAEHVELLKQGVDAWNRWREDNKLLRPDLSWANLMRADLAGADFRGADLGWANLTETKLSGANLSRAYVGRTVFVDVDLSVAKGLEEIQHQGPSTIGIDTIYRVASLTLGNVADAIATAQQAVAFADRSGDPFQKISNRATLADAMHQLGELAEGLISSLPCW